MLGSLAATRRAPARLLDGVYGELLGINLAVHGEGLVEGIPFGRYRLLESLGGGGMGKVWRAFDTATNRVVAVKVLSAHLAADPVFEQRFRREAFAAAGLNNPHVVPIHTYGEIDGRLYVDMRLIEGRNLQSVIADGPLDPARAVRIIGEVAKALNAAHKVGLVHRDVKPSNILLDDDDFAYLIDFGIARAAGETGLTTTGAVIGTWHYMAPERLGAREVDARSDIYALACVLYESLTGRHPFPGDSVESQVAAHLSAPPPRPSTTNPGVPSEFDAVIATGMAKDPDERYPTTVGWRTPPGTPSLHQCRDLHRGRSCRLPTPPRFAFPRPHAMSRSGRPAVSIGQRPPGGAHPRTPNHPAPQPLSASQAPVVAESTPRPWWRRKAAVISAAMARLRLAGERRWVVAAIAVIGVALVGGLTILIVQTSKSSNTSTLDINVHGNHFGSPRRPLQASGLNETIADYIKNNNIQQTTITPGTPGAPDGRPPSSRGLDTDSRRRRRPVWRDRL